MNTGEVKVNISKDFISKLKQMNQVMVTTAFAEKVGNAIVEESLRAIAAGTSPVRGVGRFEGYKNPARYPGTRKPSRPVNLRLTGEMLSYLSWRKVGQRLMFGIFSDAPKRVVDRVDTHNRGTHPHVPRRQFIPETGEEFIVSIQSKVKKLYRDRLLEVIARIVK